MSVPPEFVRRGTYVDVHFDCAACGEPQVWTPSQQKWWYEVASGDPESAPKHCRPCRRRERERVAEARRVHLEGLAAKRVARERAAAGRTPASSRSPRPDSSSSSA